VEVYGMKKWIGLLLLVAVLFTACSTGPEDQPEGLVTIYKLPT
jgi:hypothetical protein